MILTGETHLKLDKVKFTSENFLRVYELDSVFVEGTKFIYVFEEHWKTVVVGN